MSDFFTDLIKNTKSKFCADCGREFTTTSDQDCCFDCEYLREHPIERTKVWTWHQLGSEWGIAAYWPDQESRPAIGETVTVHKKDGSTSSATIREIEGFRYMPTGQGRLFCYVNR